MSLSPLYAAPKSCKISPLAEYLLDSPNNLPKDEMILLSDDGSITPTEGALFGNVIVQEKEGNFYSDSLFLDRVNNVIFSKDDPIYYGSDAIAVRGETFKHYLNDEVTDLIGGEYYLSGDRPAQGRAKTMHHEAREERSDLEEATYSACEVDNETWTIKSKDLRINHATGRAVAKHAFFAVRGQSVLYFPYLSFPIDGQRHSGFLSPKVQFDRNNGLTFRLPYYFNLAPNMDATLGVGVMSKRGFIFDGELRYLNEWQNSILNLEYIPEDRQKNDEKRWSLFFNQNLTFSDRLSGAILYQKVSDDDYLKDLDDTIGLLSKTNLERYASLTYNDEYVSASIRFQDFQIIDKEAIRRKPYSRLPQISVASHQTYGLLEYGVSAEFTRFITELGKNDTRAKGADRFDIKPYARLNLENSWGFFRPEIAFRYTDYSIDHRKNPRNDPESFHRSMPIFSVDTGLFFERDLELKSLFGGGEYVQTLEPRLFYLYVPYRTQSHIPMFDTSLYSPSYSALFNTTNFTGADRQNDANQVTTALTTRFINANSGVEKLRLSAGQIQYFEKNRIRLGDDLSEEEANKNRSEWFMEGEFEVIPKLYTNLTWQWSPKKSKTTKTTFDLRYQPEQDKILNLGYRYTRNDGNPNNTINQIDLSGFWELDEKWSLIGRYNHSLNNNQMIDTMAGFQYDTCCVRVQAITRYYRDTPQAKETQWRFYLMFDLKNMGSFGQSTDALLQDHITGYRYRGF